MFEGKNDSAPILIPSPSNDTSIRVIPEEWKMPIKLSEFDSVVKARDLELEYRIVRALTENDRMTSRLFLNEESKKLNRYREMVPFCENRVLLSDGSYINASYMPAADGSHKRAFIASQGPLAHTIGDQWDMIWNEGICAVFTIGNLNEGRKEKIAQYWPESKGQSEDVVSNSKKPFKISCVGQEEVFEGLIKREIILSHLGKERTVRHHHFTAWPDHGAVPPTVLINLVSLVKRERKIKQPVLVHCSAGVGRTGCVLTLSNCVEWVESQLEKNGGDVSGCQLSVMQILLALRECRVHIVERTWQYESIYAAISELIARHRTGSISFCD
jgi:protein tyrosine phosphatase